MKPLLTACVILALTGGMAQAAQDEAARPCTAEPQQLRTRPSPPGLDPEMLARNLAAADAFMAENGKKPGVVALPGSGVQYKVLQSGDPKAQCPLRKDYIKIHYEGTLPDGTVFDSSFKRDEPAIFPLSGVIPGYGEALPFMHVGDDWMIYIPPRYGYGERGAGQDIPPNSPLIFRIKLLGILSVRDAEVQPTPRPGFWRRFKALVTRA